VVVGKGGAGVELREVEDWEVLVKGFVGFLEELWMKKEGERKKERKGRRDGYREGKE
jgi:hypothetical protein